MTANTTDVMPHEESQRRERFSDRVMAHARTIEFRIMAVVLTALVLWAVAIAVFGYPALILVALTLVPIIFCLLMMITVGK